MLCYNALSDQFEFRSSGSSECTLIDLLQRVFPVFFVMYTFDVR